MTGETSNDGLAPQAASAPSGAPSAATGPAVPPSVIMSVVGRVKDYAGSVFRQRKPWTEVVDRTAFSRPESISEATSRLKKNVAYFKINYLIVIFTAIAVCMLMNPGSLLVLCALLTAWVYVFVIRSTPLVIANHTVSEQVKLMGMAAISFIVIFFLTSVGTVVFTALTIGFCLIALHGATRVPDDLFLDEAEANQNILSILTGGKQTPPLPTNV